MVSETEYEEVTGEELRAAALAKGLREIPHHRCAVCDEYVRYLIDEAGKLFFDGSCACGVMSSGPTPRDWSEAADWINMQTRAENKLRIADKFGLVLREKG